MNFGEATDLLKRGNKVARSGWNGKGMWLQLVSQWSCGERGANANYVPFIAMQTAQDTFVPWLASQTDVLATDWEVVS